MSSRPERSGEPGSVWSLLPEGWVMASGGIPDNRVAVSGMTIGCGGVPYGRSGRWGDSRRCWCVSRGSTYPTRRTGLASVIRSYLSSRPEGNAEPGSTVSGLVEGLRNPPVEPVGTRGERASGRVGAELEDLVEDGAGFLVGRHRHLAGRVGACVALRCRQSKDFTWWHRM